MFFLLPFNIQLQIRDTYVVFSTVELNLGLVEEITDNWRTEVEKQINTQFKEVWRKWADARTWIQDLMRA